MTKTECERADAKVLLINMPWSRVETPSIQLAVLKSSLKMSGINVDIHHMNLYLAIALGLKNYKIISLNRDMQLLGEWLFAEAVFGNTLNDKGFSFDGYIDHLSSQFLKQYWFYHGGSQSFLENYFGPNYRSTIMEFKNSIVENYLKSMLDIVNQHSAKIIGFTSTFNQTLASAALALLIKRHCQGKKIVMGGANFEGEMGPAYHYAFPWIDFIVSGEGDVVFPLLVDCILNNRIPDNIYGVSYWNKGKLVSNMQALPVQDLNNYPFIDYDEYFEEVSRLEGLYNMRLKGNSVFFESARGCWWGEKHHCTFCGLNGLGMKFRSKTPDRVVQELVHLSSRHNIFEFEAVDNIIDHTYFRTFIPAIINAQVDFSFFYEVKANLSKEQIRLLSEAGVTEIQAGIESLSSRVLTLMRKGSKSIQNIQTLKWCKEFGIKVFWNILYGFPDEEESDYTDMSSLIPNLFHLEPPNWPPVKIELDRFSPYFKDPQSFGIINVRPLMDYEFIYPKNRVEFDKIAYAFEYEYEKPHESEYMLPIIKATDLWRRRSDSSYKPFLIYKRGLNFIKIYDSRENIPVFYRLDGISSQIYLYCDEIRSYQNIISYAESISSEVTKNETDTILEGLIDRGLILREGDQYLSLAIPVRAMRLFNIDKENEIKHLYNNSELFFEEI